MRVFYSVLRDAMRIVGALLALGCSLDVVAAPVFTSGPTVSVANRTATFSGLTTSGNSLAAYSEGLLSITDSTGDINLIGFLAFAPGDNRTTGFWYPAQGNNGYADIKGTDNVVFTAIDFLLGDGFTTASTTTNLKWITLLNGVVTGTGVQTNLAKGRVVGWTDAGGFDELRVAANPNLASPGFGNFQAIAIDNLRAQTVPEPTTIALLGLGLAGLGFSRRKQ